MERCPVCSGTHVTVYPQEDGTFLCMCQCGAVWTK